MADDGRSLPIGDAAHRVTSVDALEALYGVVGEAARRKEIDHVNADYANFIAAAPFVVLASVGAKGVDVTPRHPGAVLWFGLLGSAFLALVGVLTSIWAEKFDHAAAVTNFVVAPLTLLSGTFYSVDHLAPAFRAFSHVNPFFYVISGFRYGFLGTADSPVLTGSVVILALDVALATLCYVLLRRGWKLKS